MKLAGYDCSPFRPQPSAKDVEWLRRLAHSVRPADLVVEVSDRRQEDEPIVFCERDGDWWCGRYVGTLIFEGHTLIIQPRFGMDTLRQWLTQATSLVLTDSPGVLKNDASFIAQLLATVWSKRFEQAARHGLPALRRQVSTRAAHVRGRLDVAASIPLLAGRTGQLVSVHAERSMDHAASSVIVAAYEVLRLWLGATEPRWISVSTRNLVLRLRSETGRRPRIPTSAELARVRYTPLTRGFEALAQLSLQIASRKGLASNASDLGRAEGVLLDVAELWELYVIDVLRKAAAPLTVTHVTRESRASKKFLHSEAHDKGMGTLIPDALIQDGERVMAIADAKYKRLHPTPSAPYGPQREDMYQIGAYLLRFGEPRHGKCKGLLLYPKDEKQSEPPFAQTFGPWRLDDARQVEFLALAHSAEEAVDSLRDVFGDRRGR